MFPAISIHRLINKNANEWFTCADINRQAQIICGTDQGLIYQTHASSVEHPSAYTQLIGAFEWQTGIRSLRDCTKDSFNIAGWILGHTKLVSDLCYYDANGSFLLSCSADRDIRLWRSLSSPCLTIYRSHLAPVWCLAVHSNSDRFASGSMDRTVRLWTPERLEILRTLIYHSDDVNTLAFHPNGKYLASGSSDGLIVLWSLEQAQPARVLQSTSPIERLTFTSDGNYLISTSTHRERACDSISSWDIRSTKERRLIEDIPRASRLLKPCQIQDTERFATGLQQSVLVFGASPAHEEKDVFRSNFSEQSLKRLLHLSSHQSNELLVIGEWMHVDLFFSRWLSDNVASRSCPLK